MGKTFWLVEVMVKLWKKKCFSLTALPPFHTFPSISLPFLSSLPVIPGMPSRRHLFCSSLDKLGHLCMESFDRELQIVSFFSCYSCRDVKDVLYT